MSILIKGALLDGAVTDVYIEKKEIRQVGTDLQVQADQVIDGRRKALIPGFVNAHTHAAMTLFRGFGDDMPLMPWLEQKIWPNEAKLTREDVYWGTKLACLEMIKSGTTTFFDMYHKFRATADAVEEMGLRALLAGVCFDHFKPELAEKSKRENEKLVVDVENYSKRIRYASVPMPFIPCLANCYSGYMVLLPSIPSRFICIWQRRKAKSETQSNSSALLLYVIYIN